VLARGDLDRALTIRAPRVSTAARAKIEAAGGSIDAAGPRERPAPAAADAPDADASGDDD